LPKTQFFGNFDKMKFDKQTVCLEKWVQQVKLTKAQRKGRLSSGFVIEEEVMEWKLESEEVAATEQQIDSYNKKCPIQQ
jgi:hypothetical protein